jgi:hypothetical protein
LLQFWDESRSEWAEEHRILAPGEGVAVARRRLAAATSGRRSAGRRWAEDATAAAP